MRHVFLVGAKSFGNYGGFETFIDKLTEYHQYNSNVKYHAATKMNGQGAGVPKDAVWCKGCANRYTYHNVDVFQIKVPEYLGAAQAIYYDVFSIKACIDIIKNEHINDFIIYIMACRIGPFVIKYVDEIHKLGGRVFLNPDGHEWKRGKWSYWVRKYWKMSERLMVRYADKVICDSINIERYIQTEYDKNSTTFIPYGAETRNSKYDNEKLISWLNRNNIINENYYLIVGRFVPENNYEIMIREFMKSDTDKSLVIICNNNDKFKSYLENKIQYSNDKRIKFVGTVYDDEMLLKIRENAYAYIHGHEVGGTNPSLLEALGSTKLNLLLDVPFNKEVAEDSALYWDKSLGCLCSLINKVDKINRDSFAKKAKARIQEKYNWSFVCKRYEDEWLR